MCFAYDALARRTRKVVRDAGAQSAPEREVRFVWDGEVPLHEVASEEGLTTWLFEPESFSPLAREDVNGRYAVVTDHLGVPTEMYDELGQLAWRMQLDAFGVGTVRSSAACHPEAYSTSRRSHFQRGVAEAFSSMKK